ncbi:MAG: c-type cytochrome [Bacteroidetes bacterium]|nr:c-type cytochrome [Bacteroidota bacterium]
MIWSIVKYGSVFFVMLMISCMPEKHEKVLKEPSTIEALGELLFNDSILSRENQISCASCHKPDYAFADNVPFSFGVDSVKGGRNTPSTMNMSARNFYFHDGRSETLEDQAGGPMENPAEMDIPMSVIVRKLNNHKQYRAFFIKLFGTPANKQNLVEALAAYERTLETNNSAFDNYMSEKDTTLFSASAKRGRVIFNEKGKCFDCHFGPDFTNDDFKNIGLFNGKNLNDSGRYIITRDEKDIGRFKVPGLRNIAITKPYMHNGMFKSLKEVIDYYDQPDKFISNSVNRDTLLSKPLGLTDQEKKDLEAFLMSLTDARFLNK